jgi:hypothetical protein
MILGKGEAGLAGNTEKYRRDMNLAIKENHFFSRSFP